MNNPGQFEIKRMMKGKKKYPDIVYVMWANSIGGNFWPTYQLRQKQAEVEVVPSSSLVKIRLS